MFSIFTDVGNVRQFTKSKIMQLLKSIKSFSSLQLFRLDSCQESIMAHISTLSAPSSYYCLAIRNVPNHIRIDDMSLARMHARAYVKKCYYRHTDWVVCVFECVRHIAAHFCRTKAYHMNYVDELQTNLHRMFSAAECNM